ncbi:hypothetical protein [Scytonema sp. NUACC26]|uniref:hypothetical protein n=1 Tax=Scytonema sp. NUACC26 TaxID=3140176 RepID=UPI0034DC618D
MTNNPIDPKKKINPNQEPNELSEQELESVAGGGIIDDVKDFAKDVYKEGKELISDIKKAL